MNKKLSIAICTHNRLALLDEAMQSILQSPAANQVEVLLIDNCSVDGTAEYAEKLALENEGVRYFKEEKLGLSNARNRAVQECATEYIGFVDDDARIPKGGLERMLQIINEHKPDVFGGPIYPYYRSQKPDWFKDSYEVRRHQEKTGWTSAIRYSGSNLFMKADLFRQVGLFETTLGMSGNKVAYGEETEWLMRAKALDVKFYYDIQLIIEHLVPEAKMNVLFFLLSNYRSGKNGEQMNPQLDEKGVSYLLDNLDEFFEELNTLLFINKVDVEQGVVEKQAYTFHQIGRAAQHLRVLDQGSAGMSSLDKLENDFRKRKRISFASYLRSVASLTKKFLRSQR